MVQNAQKIVDAMMHEDAFSEWLGIRAITIKPGYCHVQMQVTPAMCNGFGIAHGGIAFSLCDSACSFAVNAHGRKAMSVENSISQFKAVQPGDVLNCFVQEESLGRKLGVYSAEIFNHEEVKIAVFKGTYYRSDKKWFEEAVAES
ncbi:MAG: hotdog fold thioesterase [Chitinophagaceae bacterium]|jgi:acyl-CoA thioesterase|nr:hotdog fold thioesterase [Chitinophagaceae bacterium]